MAQHENEYARHWQELPCHNLHMFIASPIATVMISSILNMHVEYTILEKMLLKSVLRKLKTQASYFQCTYFMRTCTILKEQKRLFNFKQFLKCMLLLKLFSYRRAYITWLLGFFSKLVLNSHLNGHIIYRTLQPTMSPILVKNDC